MPEDLTAEDKRFIKRLRERAESSDVSRRDLLQLGGATGLGALLGAGGLFGMSGGARAGTAQVGTLGEPGSPIDAHIEDAYGPGGQGSGDAVTFEGVNATEKYIDPTGYTHEEKLVGAFGTATPTAYFSGPTHGEGGDAFSGAALAPDGRVILAPFDSSNVGITGFNLGVAAASWGNR